MSDRIRVSEYMTRDVITVSPGDTVRDASLKILKTRHDGFPVVEDGKVVGYVSSRDLLMCSPDERIEDVMTRDPIVAHPSMDLSDVARVIFRSGISKLPVVDDDGNLVGIITNSDVIRSQIERADPSKVWKLKRTLETLHGIEIEVVRERVRVDELMPTQPKIYADELEGRTYELKRGLAEPLIVIEKPNKKLLVDGHHRVVAAKYLGINSIDAYVLKLRDDVPLGMERTASDAGLRSIDDIKIIDSDRHPLIEITRRASRRS